MTEQKRSVMIVCVTASCTITNHLLEVRLNLGRSISDKWKVTAICPDDTGYTGGSLRETAQLFCVFEISG